LEKNLENFWEKYFNVYIFKIGFSNMEFAVRQSLEDNWQIIKFKDLETWMINIELEMQKMYL